MTDRLLSVEPLPAHPASVLDLSDRDRRTGRIVLVVDDEFAVEWQIERPPTASASRSGADREPQLV